jgi:Rieske Fe-S protein
MKTSGKILELEIGKEADYSRGAARVIRFGDEKVIVSRTKDGSFHAVSAECTHLGCSVRFVNDGRSGEFACNCHESRFDLDGKNLTGPAPRPLKHYEIRLRGADLILRSQSMPET